MQINVHVVRFDGWGGPQEIAAGLVRTAQAVEAAGAEGMTLMDHYFQIEGVGAAEEPMLEGYTTLGFLAAHTTRASLGLMVTGVTYRLPGLLAKVVSTLDVLSGGRAVLGIGAAWFEREHLGLGVPYPPLAERFERLEETLQICRQMWSDDDGPYTGRHYQLAETVCVPRPLSTPRPRIVVGGSGERKTLRLVAQYADACNLFAPSPEVVAHKLEVLRRHCDEVGRDPATLATTILYVGPHGALDDRDAFLREMAAYATLGVGQVHVMPGGRPEQWVEERVAPLVADLRAL
jgi:F420-dependent oxidoreductase-like protein